MWIRSELKTNAKISLRTSYWMAFAVSLVAGLLGGAGSSTGLLSFNPFGLGGNVQFRYRGFGRTDPGHFWDAFSGIVAVFAVIGAIILTLFILFQIFVGNPMRVGHSRWYSRNREAVQTPFFRVAFSAFRSPGYMKTVSAMFWMQVRLFLFGLLALIPLALMFILYRAGVLAPLLFERADSIDSTPEMALLILAFVLLSFVLSLPAIIMSYAYRLTPWILADNPLIGTGRAIRLSAAMTRGHKWRIFILDLSFIGWFLLGILTCGIGILFLNPYVNATFAELYARLRQIAVGAQMTTMEELGYQVYPQ